MMTVNKNARCRASGVLLSAVFEAGAAAVAATAVVASASWAAEGWEERPAAGEQYEGGEQSGFGQLGKHRGTMGHEKIGAK
jgi:hypothetical protein